MLKYECSSLHLSVFRTPYTFYIYSTSQFSVALFPANNARTWLMADIRNRLDLLIMKLHSLLGVLQVGGKVGKVQVGAHRAYTRGFPALQTIGKFTISMNCFPLLLDTVSTFTLRKAEQTLINISLPHYRSLMLPIVASLRNRLLGWGVGTGTSG